MGNRIGSHKAKDQRTKDEKRKEKDEKKEKEKLLKKEKKERKKKQHGSGLDADLDDSSHVTGGDSESCVFHSAENISASPYLDACTRSELEQGSSWSGMYESFTSASQHPQVLSAKDFKDGFSLEACLPPEIARVPEQLCDDASSSATSRFEGRSGSSVRSRKSNTSVKSSSAQPRSLHDTPTSFRSQHAAADDVGSIGNSSQISGGYHTPLLSTPVFGRADAPISPASVAAASTLSRVSETDPNDCMDIGPAPSAVHHPHFYNHQKLNLRSPTKNERSDFRNLPKPTSPHPQRRALSPKMTSSPIKLISSDDSSSSHTTPTPQRRANLLDLFRSGSKKSKTKETKTATKQGEEGGNSKGDKSGPGSNEPDGKDKSKPLWKTWERSKAKKSDKANKTSIFGTTRKSDKSKTGRTMVSEMDSQLEKNYTMKNDTAKCEIDSSSGNSPSYKYQKSDKSSSRSSGSHYEGRDDSKEDSGLRSSSSPIVRSAAFCIMKLEQLERSIEETIREKFPDAEPFLLKKRSREDETRGSRSLPSTPSLKKKLYVARDANDSKRNSQKDSGERGDANGKTRYCDETFEVCPSPAMSPVILRRFGARTRHASISPKIPRAKTAVLYNSPSEISSIEKSVSTKTVTKVPVYHAVSSYPHQTPPNSTQFMKPLKSSQKSASKYDNVIDDWETSGLQIQSSKAEARFPSGRSNSEGEEEDNSFGPFSGNDARNVIVPTFSAVFGSVSPKLKRHLQTKFEESKLTEGHTSSLIGGKSRSIQTERSDNLKATDIRVESPKSTYLSNTCVHVPSHLVQDSSIHKQNKSVEIVYQPGNVQSKGNKTELFNTNTSGSPTDVSTPKDVSSNIDGQVSVRQRVTTLNRTVSEGQPSNNADLISRSNNTGVSAPTREQVTAASHSREPAQVPGVPPAQRRTRTRGNAGPRVQQQQASRVDTKAGETEKSTVLISPGAQRKHSTDHVVFGSAVALPCRLYSNVPPSPTSKCLEETGNVDIPSTEVSRENIVGQSQNVKYVTKQQIPLCEVDKTEQNGSNSITTESRDGSNSCVSTLTANNVIQSVLSFNISAVKDKNTHLDNLAVSSSSNASVNLKDNHSIVSTQRQDAGTIRDTRKIVFDDYKPSFREDEQRFVVLKNPVSKVISEMINSSKQEEQEEKQRLEQQQIKKLHQSSPGYGVKHVQEAIATVRSPAYEQTCLRLEEKTVRSDSSVSLPSSPTNNRIERDFSNSSDQEVKESRSQEIQTDSITTADKGVDSNSLTRSTEFKRSTQHSKSIPMVREVCQRNVSQPLRMNNAESTFKEENDLSSSDEIELLKNVLASRKSDSQKKYVCKGDDEAEQGPPPPSPNAMQQLLEEFEEEEEENVEAMERKEIEMALRRESEIKEFTDKIYNRLSSLLGSQEEMEDNVFEDEVKETPTTRDVGELLSRLETKRESPYTSSSSEDDMELFISGSSKIPASEVGQSKLFTLESSSSLTTTTSSSESDPYEEPPLYQPPAEMIDDDFGVDDGHESGERFEREIEPNVFVFPEIETANENGGSVEVQMRRSSREYHSDDDVATGKGIPDYYDDRPLWTRRQKTPGQLSAAMMAIRRRERRERWLKKRKRNRTDLLSTGSSDTGSEMALNDRTGAQPSNDTSYYNYDDDDEFAENEKMIQRQEMGSGMLTSPKYSKPILPFGNSIATQRTDHKKASPKLISDRSQYMGERSKSLSGDESHFSNTLASSKIDTRNYDRDAKNVGSSCDEDDEQKARLAEDALGYSPGSNLAIPGIEETFNELMSVKHILEGIQNRTPANETSSSVKCMPLTTENVKSIREYYKDCYSSGRRSRLSAADRTESDLDLYSESRDDESTDSNFNADDEEDEDNLEPYATADDENAATSGSAGLSHRGGRRGLGDDDDSETNVVVSCTFYNSNAFPPAAAVVDGTAGSFKTPSTPVAAKTSVMSTPKTLTPTAQASVLNSDEEFWAGSAACEERYRQVVTTADAVSSTFQNAREQMHEIQHHLQALRRQMEVLQDDLSTTSTTKNQERT